MQTLEQDYQINFAYYKLCYKGKHFYFFLTKCIEYLCDEGLSLVSVYPVRLQRVFKYRTFVCFPCSCGLYRSLLTVQVLIVFVCGDFEKRNVITCLNGFYCQNKTMFSNFDKLVSIVLVCVSSYYYRRSH